MPTVIFGNAREFLIEHSEKYPHWIETPIDQPRPAHMENEMFFTGNWIAGSVNGIMHWRFEQEADLKSFKKKYGSF